MAERILMIEDDAALAGLMGDYTGASYGLGLALVRQIARAHGGEARCLPREGGGTVLEVVLGA